MLRRLAYLFLTIIILILMVLPIFAFVLAARGELRVGDDQGSHIRLFMVNSDQAEGIGIQRVRDSSTADGCQQGSVRYFLWDGQSEELDGDYCICPESRSGEIIRPGRCRTAQ